MKKTNLFATLIMQDANVT